MVREVEKLAEYPLVRWTVELLRPIPIGRVEVEATLVKRGSSVERLEAVLTAEGKVCAQALGLTISKLDIERLVDPTPVSPPPPETSGPFTFPFFGADVDYQAAMELRIAEGQFGRGKMAAWLRMRKALVSGEEPTPWQRLAVAADSGSGVGAALDTDEFGFVNPDLTIYVNRAPEGEWIGLNTLTRVHDQGVGFTEAEIWDTAGVLGRSVQSLVVRPT